MTREVGSASRDEVDEGKEEREEENETIGAGWWTVAG
jgi:hypothetical protein